MRRSSPLKSILLVLPFLATDLEFPTPAIAAPVAQLGSCVVDDDDETPVLECGGDVIDVRLQLFESALARLRAREAEAINGVGLYERYLAWVAPSQQDTIGNLWDLSALLATDYPELYGAFVVDADDALTRLQTQVARQTDTLISVYRRVDPEIGSDPIPLPDRDLLAELLAELDPDSYVTSGSPLEVMAVDQGEPPIGILPFIFSSLTALGPTVSTGDTIDSSSRSELTLFTVCDDGSPVCIWPVGWDLLPYSIHLVWESLTLTEAEVEAIVLEDGYRLTLSVNGMKLRKGPPFTNPLQDPLQGYTVATLPVDPCPQGRQCIATQVLARDRLRTIPLPWRFELKVEKIVDLDIPVAIVDPESGEVTGYIDKGAEPFSTVNRTISANDTNDRSWFDEAIAPTFESQRCIDCHSFGTIDAIGEHHYFLGYGGGQAFADAVGLELEPSAYVPNAHVMTCQVGCHTVPLTDNHGSSFEEVVWKAPYFDLDVDWSSKTPAQICARVVSNLPTKELRHKHFSEDARLFWAIEAPFIMGDYLEPKAAPQDFDEFLMRIFIWNWMGAPCP